MEALLDGIQELLPNAANNAERDNSSADRQGKLHSLQSVIRGPQVNAAM